MRALVNLALFQAGWFASVLAASRGLPWIGVGAVAAIVCLHLLGLGKRREIRLVAACAAVGLAIDTVFLQTGIVSYASPTRPSWLAPAWIVAMWANFAITLEHSLAWLARRPVVSGVLGAVAGPAAYWGASGLGAVQLPIPFLSTLVLAAVWGASVPALLRLGEPAR